MAGPDWASITTAVGTGVLGLTGLIGVVAANNRVRRGIGEIEAGAFDDPAGTTAVRVRAMVRSTGLGRLQTRGGRQQETFDLIVFDPPSAGSHREPSSRWPRPTRATGP